MSDKVTPISAYIECSDGLLGVPEKELPRLRLLVPSMAKSGLIFADRTVTVDVVKVALELVLGQRRRSIEWVQNYPKLYLSLDFLEKRGVSAVEISKNILGEKLNGGKYDSKNISELQTVRSYFANNETFCSSEIVEMITDEIERHIGDSIAYLASKMQTLESGVNACSCKRKERML